MTNRAAFAILFAGLSSAAAFAATSPVTVLLESPPGWTVVDLPPPDLSQTPQIVLAEWRAWGPPTLSPTRLVTACFTAETETWTEEAEGLALDKIAQMATSTALRIAGIGGLRPTATEHALAVASQRLEGAGDAQNAATAHTFLGFVSSGLVGCFALCIDPGSLDGARAPACASSVAGATVNGAFRAPPKPTASVRTLLFAVHHPGLSGVAVAALGVLGAALAIVTRKRPRIR